jgi:ABC-type glycerol-3-phosphate transport system substrate-binding protein
MVWYCHQIEGPDRISFPCGWDQPLNEAMINGLALFYICPDWRANQTKSDVPMLAGKMSLIPLPTWTEGGCRTTTWGGTGLTITKQCVDEGKFDLAWKLAMFLYYDPSQLGKRFHDTGILPPLKEAWSLPEFKVPSDFFAGVSQGQVYSALAPQVPPEPSSPYQNMARDKLGEAFTNTADFYKANGFRDDGLREFAQNEIHRVAEQVRKVMARNTFLPLGKSNSQTNAAAGGSR